MSGGDFIAIFVFMLSGLILHLIDSCRINNLNKRIEELEEEIKELNKYLVPCTEMVKEGGNRH